MLSEKPWRGTAVFRLLLGLMASMLLGMWAISLLESRARTAPGEAHAQFAIFLAGTISFHGVGLLLISIFLREHGVGWGEAFGFLRPRLKRAIALGLVAGCLVLPIAWSLSQLSARVLRSFQREPVMQEQVQTLQQTRTLSERVYFGFVAMVLAPLMEEMLFRGILYPALKHASLPGYAWLFRRRLYPWLRGRRWQTAARWTRWGISPALAGAAKPRFALWSTSLLFAASHGNLMTFVPLTFLAVVLTLLYESTDNLFAPILTHSFFNGANFFWLVLGG